MTKAKQPVPEQTADPHPGYDCGGTCAVHLFGSTVIGAAPERIFIKACHPATPNRNCSWRVSDTPQDGVQYIRADRATQSPEPPSADADVVAREIVESMFGKEGESPIYQTAGRSITELVSKFAAALTTAQAKQREVDAGIAETKAGRRCLRHQQSGKGVCGYEIADAIRAGGKQ